MFFFFILFFMKWESARACLTKKGSFFLILSIAIKRSEKETKFRETFLRPFSLFVVAYCCCSIVGHSLFLFSSKFISPFFLIRDFPHVECVFWLLLFYSDPFHRHNNNTHSAAAAALVCWASFLVIVEVGRRFFRSIFVRLSKPDVCDPLKMREHNHEENEKDEWEHA
jgi:hypothetical protein